MTALLPRHGVERLDPLGLRAAPPRPDAQAVTLAAVAPLLLSLPVEGRIVTSWAEIPVVEAAVFSLGHLDQMVGVAASLVPTGVVEVTGPGSVDEEPDGAMDAQHLVAERADHRDPVPVPVDGLLPDPAPLDVLRPADDEGESFFLGGSVDAHGRMLLGRTDSVLPYSDHPGDD